MTQMKRVFNNIRSYGEDISDQKVVEKVFRRLPEKFDMVVTSHTLSYFMDSQLWGAVKFSMSL